MTVLRRPFQRSRRLARALLWEYGVDEPAKIDPFVIVGRHKIKVTHGKLDGASARIYRKGERAIIRVSDQIIQPGRLRFTIAHEVAHFLLGHRLPTDLDLAPEASPAFSKHQERECDVFATEYLMPEAWITPLCVETPLSLSAVDRIAAMFRTSVVASSVRHVELTSLPCAVAYSEAGTVTWAKRSRSFPGRIPAQLGICGNRLAPDSADYLRDDQPRGVPAHTWRGRGRGDGYGEMFMEQSTPIPEPGWGGVLTLIGICRDQQSTKDGGR